MCGPYIGFVNKSDTEVNQSHILKISLSIFLIDGFVMTGRVNCRTRKINKR